MTVKDALEQLSLMPGDALMVQSVDEEGNAFPVSHEFTRGVYQLGWKQFCDAEEADGADGYVPAVCLWPQ